MTNSSDTHTHRRTALKLAGATGLSLAGLTGTGAAHPGNSQGKGKNKGKPQNSEEEDEDDEQEQNPGQGRGQWCCSNGWGRDEGPGYQRRYPHEDDETRWDDWEPGDGRPPWARGDGEDEDEDEDDEDEDEDETPDEGDGDDETYIWYVWVGQDEPEEGVEVLVEHSDGSTDTETTDENGRATFELSEGEYTASAEGYEDVEFTADQDGEFYLPPEDDDDDSSEDPEDPPNEEPEEPENPDEGDDSDDSDDSEDSEDEEPTLVTQIEERIHEEVNTYREEQDAPPLEQSDELAEVARAHSEDMAETDYFDHDSPDGDGPGDRLDEAGVECNGWGENLAWEESSNVTEGDAESIADSAVQGWIDSEGHRQNLLGNYDEEGIGVATTGNEVFITQLFCSN